MEFGNDHQQASGAVVASSGASANFTSPATMLAALRAYQGKLDVSDEQFKGVMVAASRTPGGRMYFASVEEQMQLGFFTTRK